MTHDADQGKPRCHNCGYDIKPGTHHGYMGPKVCITLREPERPPVAEVYATQEKHEDTRWLKEHPTFAIGGQAAPPLLTLSILEHGNDGKLARLVLSLDGGAAKFELPWLPSRAAEYICDAVEAYKEKL